MTNIYNPEAVDAYLAEFAGDDAYFLTLLKIALSKPLLKEEDCVIDQPVFPDDAPDWLSAKWDSAGPWSQWRPSTTLRGKVKHIADWIKAAQINGAEWLQNQDKKGRPHLLLKLSTIDQATKCADRAMHSLSVQFRHVAEEEGAVEVVKEWEAQGFKMVRLLKPQALQRESGMMGHCIGEGYHAEKLESGECEYYSLRDADNKAHATIEVQLFDQRVLECKGKQNLPPVEKYMPFVRDFITERQYALDEEPKNTGLILVDGVYHDVNNLPEGLTIDAHTFEQIMEAGVTNFPKNLNVEGNVLIWGKTMEVFPPVTINGHLNLKGSHIGKFQGPLKAIAADLSNCEVDAFEADFQAQCDIDLSYARLGHLPNGFMVDGDLELGYSDLKELPENMTVKGGLNIQNTKITRCPKHFTAIAVGFSEIGFEDISQAHHLTIIGDVNWYELGHGDHPANMTIIGDLDLSEVPIFSLPEGLNVTGTIRTPSGRTFSNVEDAQRDITTNPFEVPDYVDLPETDTDTEGWAGLGDYDL